MRAAQDINASTKSPNEACVHTIDHTYLGPHMTNIIMAHVAAMGTNTRPRYNISLAASRRVSYMVHMAM